MYSGFEQAFYNAEFTGVRIRRALNGRIFKAYLFFAYSFMKLILIYVKVVKYFSLWHNYILDVPASSAQKLMPGKVPARINISGNGKYPQIHFLEYLNWFFFLKLYFSMFVSWFWKQFALNFTKQK